jgi:hypothetical protein
MTARSHTRTARKERRRVHLRRAGDAVAAQQRRERRAELLRLRRQSAWPGPGPCPKPPKATTPL